MGVQERRQREREARKKAVLDAARTLVQERGFNGTTSKEIAKLCELSEATLFFYFKSKDEIFISLLLEGIDLTGRGIEEIAAADLPPAEMLTRLWNFFSEVRNEHPEYHQVFAYLAQPASTGAVSDEVKLELAQRSGDNFRRLAELLKETLGVDDPRLCADLMWASFVGLMVLRDCRVNLGAQPHPNDADLQRIFKRLLPGLLAGDGEESST